MSFMDKLKKVVGLSPRVPVMMAQAQPLIINPTKNEQKVRVVSRLVRLHQAKAKGQDVGGEIERYNKALRAIDVVPPNGAAGAATLLESLKG